MTQGLRGRTVLVPRGGAWGERVRADLAARGAVGVIAPLIDTRPPRDLAERTAAFARLAAGEYGWVFLTSAAAVEQLLAADAAIPTTTRVAVVGAATARAARDAGYRVDFVPDGPASAAAMITRWCGEHDPVESGRALVLRSDLAMAAVSDELEVRGFAVDVCIAYRTVGQDLAPDVRDRLRAGAIDTVLLTSASVARELAAQGGVGASVQVGSLGPATTREALRHGIPVAVTAPLQHMETLLDALDDALPGLEDPASASQEDA